MFFTPLHASRSRRPILPRGHRRASFEEEHIGNDIMSATATRPVRPEDDVIVLRNVGKAIQADLRLLGVATVGELATRDADALYIELAVKTGARHDPCVHDIFAAAIHQARTGEALAWWDFTPARKVRQKAGRFV
jgi:hypothetical protein